MSLSMFLHNKIHVTLPEGGAGEVRHGQPDGDQPAGADITHVGGLLSGGLEARDGLAACRPPVSRLSLLSAAQHGCLLRSRYRRESFIYAVGGDAWHVCGASAI